MVYLPKISGERSGVRETQAVVCCPENLVTVLAGKSCETKIVDHRLQKKMSLGDYTLASQVRLKS